MSRVGKKPVILPSGTSVSFTDGVLTVKGSKGQLELPVHPRISLDIQPDAVTVAVPSQENKKDKALWGLFRALIQNTVDGVNKGFEKKLEVNGVGFKVSLTGNVLTLSLGFSHPIEVNVPAELTVTVEKNLITISGIDKQLVGQFAANVRSLKPPEPYKGKGIKYLEETIIRKAGKVVKAVGK
jgi:large subunit ribosomal protein L6